MADSLGLLRLRYRLCGLLYSGDFFRLFHRRLLGRGGGCLFYLLASIQVYLPQGLERVFLHSGRFLCHRLGRRFGLGFLFFLILCLALYFLLCLFAGLLVRLELSHECVVLLFGKFQRGADIVGSKELVLAEKIDGGLQTDVQFLYSLI